jgi:cobalt-zinc-cadmium efflux system protein
VKAAGVAAIAVLGVLFNGAAAWRLRGGKSLNEQVASWHLLEDTLGWLAVLVGGSVMWVWDVPVIDPLLALVIALVVVWNVFGNLRKVGLVFLQAAPHGFDADAFDRQLSALPGVIGSHHTHTWTLDGEFHVFSTHLVLSRESTRDDIVAVKRQVHELLRGHHFEHITVEVELEGESCASEGGQYH